MPKKTVVDSSVIIKWLNTDNELSLEQSDKLLQEALDGKVELLAPELAKYEVGNVLLKGKQLSPAQAKISLETVYTLPITYVADSQGLAEETYLLAHNLGITYYDASFMSLARQHDAVLVTENIKHQAKSKRIKVTHINDY